jgi:hypothetical protein
VRHLQIARAAFAAVAAIMVTFSPDHSAAYGMSIFSGFGILTGITFLAAVWLVYPAGRRWPAVLLGGLGIAAGMVSSLATMRTVTGFFVTVVTWALLSGLIEAIAGWRDLRLHRATNKPQREIAPGVVDAGPWVGPGPASEARDGVVVGVITMILGVALLFVPAQYALRYTIEEAHQTFTLTGITIGVGVFGAYAVVIAVYLGIAAFSPRKPLITEAPAEAPADQKDHA